MSAAAEKIRVSVDLPKEIYFRMHRKTATSRITHKDYIIALIRSDLAAVSKYVSK